MTATLEDLVVARRRSLILKYRAAWRQYAMPWLASEVFELSAAIGHFNREYSDQPITRDDIKVKL